MRETGFDPWVRKIPWRRERLPTPVFWPGGFHGLYNPRGHKESDTTELLSLSLFCLLDTAEGLPAGSVLKNLAAMKETQVRSQGRENPLENGMATHSSILAWRIPRTEEPGGLQSMGSQTGRHGWATNTHSHGWRHREYEPCM